MDNGVRYLDRFTRKRGGTTSPRRSVRAEARKDDGFDTSVPAGHYGLRIGKKQGRSCGFLNTAAPIADATRLNRKAYPILNCDFIGGLPLPTCVDVYSHKLERKNADAKTGALVRITLIEFDRCVRSEPPALLTHRPKLRRSLDRTVQWKEGDSERVSGYGGKRTGAISIIQNQITNSTHHWDFRDHQFYFFTKSPNHVYRSVQSAIPFYYNTLIFEQLDIFRSLAAFFD